MTYQKRAKRWGYSVSLLAILTSAVITSPRSAAEVQDIPEMNMQAESSAGTGTEPYIRGTEGSSGVHVVPMMYVVRTIHYVYEDGATAAPDAVEALLFGGNSTDDGWVTVDNKTYTDIYTSVAYDDTFDAVSSPEISGYIADQTSIPEVAGVRPTVTVEESNLLPGRPRVENIEITVTYKKNAEAPIQAEETTISPAAENSVIPVSTSPIGELENLNQITTEPIATIAAPVSAPQPGRKVLPSTGESAGNAVVLFGGIAVLGGAVLGLAARHKCKQN